MHNLPGIGSIDTRALTRRIRDLGAPRGTLCHAPEGAINFRALRETATGWPGLMNMDLASEVSCDNAYDWRQGSWQMDRLAHRKTAPKYNVVAVDFGCKHNIFRCLEDAGCAVHVVPAKTTADEILSLKPDGVFLQMVPVILRQLQPMLPRRRQPIDQNIPIFGICIGHQLMALALGAKTNKMERGYRGANHPVKDLVTGKIEITSQNHGFVVNPDSLQIV